MRCVVIAGLRVRQPWHHIYDALHDFPVIASRIYLVMALWLPQWYDRTKGPRNLAFTAVVSVPAVTDGCSRTNALASLPIFTTPAARQRWKDAQFIHDHHDVLMPVEYVSAAATQTK